MCLPAWPGSKQEVSVLVEKHKGCALEPISHAKVHYIQSLVMANLHESSPLSLLDHLC